MRKLSLEELERISVRDFKSSKKLAITIVLDDIRSAMNVGSIFRTADAFRIQKIVLCGITATPPHKEILKTAIGANESVDWEYCENVLQTYEKLKAENNIIIGIEQTSKSQSILSFEPAINISYALFFGNEVHGLNDELLPLLDQAIEIPQFGIKHSLNVAVCAGIVLWHFAKERLKVL